MTGATKRDMHRLVALQTVDRSGDDHWLFNGHVSWGATCSCG